MERLSVLSCAAYRKIVREDPRFVPYFRTATPGTYVCLSDHSQLCRNSSFSLGHLHVTDKTELELSGLNVGSRPAKRNPKGGVESLRAIPWQFAWTQTRLNLPAWLVGNSIRINTKKKNVETANL